MQVAELFSLTGKTAVVAGGGGVLGGAIAKGLAAAGASVLVTDLRPEMADAVVKEIEATGGVAKGAKMDAFDKDTIVACRDLAYDEFGSVDILFNAVGGNMKGATTSDDQSFFQLPSEALSKVFDLNIMAGTIVPCQVFGERMKDNADGGCIINISSMCAFSPLTRVAGYSAAKAAVSNFTQWLSVHFAQEYTTKLRVNAIAPGFFLTDQNRFLLTDEKTGELTARGKTIIDHTPQAEFGKPEDLVGVAIWLASAASEFVTGIVVPIDGGFSAFSGV
jgi:NAD(P)-dependent dehydrogenase (short-subunit alcohol dehydrogenase family)